MGEEDTRVEEAEAELAAGREAYARGDLTAAEAHFREGLAAAPDHPWLNSVLGVVLAAQGPSSEASERLRRAAELSGYSDPLIVSNLVTLLLTMPVESERLEAAEQALRQALGRDGFAILHAQLGWVLELRGQARAARAEYLHGLRMPLGFPRKEGSADLGEWYELALAGLLRTSMALWGSGRFVLRVKSSEGEAGPGGVEGRAIAREGGWVRICAGWLGSAVVLAACVFVRVYGLLPDRYLWPLALTVPLPALLPYVRRHFEFVSIRGWLKAVPRKAPEFHAGP